MSFFKRVFLILLTLFLLVGFCSTATMAEAAPILYGIGFVSTAGLNLRRQPNTNSEIIATAGCGECIVLIGLNDGWYHVIYNLQEGYMSAEYLSAATAENAELGYGRVTGTTVNLRSGPDTSYPKVGTASLGERYYIIGLNQGWYKILTNSGSCYIRSDYLELTELPYENRKSSISPRFFRGGHSLGTVPSLAAVSGTATAVLSTASASGSVSGSAILQKAQQYLGTPYAYGGASPAGFDCSGFVYYIYGCFGFSVGRTPAEQGNVGISVDKSNLQPGDIVLFAGTGSSGISHSGIYAGNGQFIHSPNSRSTVSYSDLNSGYWAEHFCCGRRVV